MKSTLTIRLDKDLERLLDRQCKRTGQKRSEIVRDALRRELSLRRFEDLRRRTLPFAEARGYLTDEDVMRDVARVFLDTNVLAAAFAARGLCADVVRYVLAEHQLITGDVVLDELRVVLTNRFKLPASTTKDILDLLQHQVVVAKPNKPASMPARDADDAWILASALVGLSDVLVTGDHDLLDIADVAPLPILSPRGFWEFVRKKQG